MNTCRTCPFTSPEALHHPDRVAIRCDSEKICRNSLSLILQESTRRDLADIETLGQNGLLLLSSLKEGDALHICIGHLEQPYYQSPDRELKLEIAAASRSEGEPIIASVAYDAYCTLPHNDLRRQIMLPRGSQIALIGAYDHPEDKEVGWEMHRGRGLWYESATGEMYTGPIHEIILERGGNQAVLFHQDLSELPERPPLSGIPSN